MMSATLSRNNRFQLGPRTRAVVRGLARILNPLVLQIAGRRWMPIVGILYHRGRRTGRVYRTPLGMRSRDGNFYFPRTFGDESAWYQNVLAAGWARVTYLGRTHNLVEPEVVDGRIAAPAFPGYELLQFRLIGINEFLRLRVAPDGWTAPTNQ